LLITLIKFDKVVAPSKKDEKKNPLLSTTFIDRFEGSCGTFGEEKNTQLFAHGLVCPRKKKSKK